MDAIPAPVNLAWLRLVSSVGIEQSIEVKRATMRLVSMFTSPTIVNDVTMEKNSLL